MSSNQRPVSATGIREKTYFEQQREALIKEIALVRTRIVPSCGLVPPTDPSAPTAELQPGLDQYQHPEPLARGNNHGTSDLLAPLVLIRDGALIAL